MSERIIYHVGYRSGWTPKSLSAEIRRRGFCLVDVRFAPGRPGAVWSSRRLEALLGDFGYCWLGYCLGNRNYRGGPIDLADEALGLNVLAEMCLMNTKPPVLMCACETFETCHRRTIIERLTERLGTMRAVELTPAARTGGGGLFGG